ncbi:retrovirus-related pol polyprotein from transposon TNT 1-94 [Tanacetum coccineum]
MIFKKEESRNIDREFALEKKIKQLDIIVFKRDQSVQTVHMLTKPQFFYDHTTKQALGFQNPFYLKKAQQLEPKLYDGNVIKNTSAIVIPDSKETLVLAEESRSKMLLKQQDPMMLEKKVNITPVNYAVLNQLSQDFEKRFVLLTELSAEQPLVLEFYEFFKLILLIDSPKLRFRKNFLKSAWHTQEQAMILREIVEQGKSQNPLNNSLDSALRVKPSTSASRSQPSGNTKKDKIQQTPVVQIVLWYLDSGCSKHMTGDHSQLTNFVNKFLGTVKFGNDHVAKILGYDMMVSSPICLLSKASKTKSWLWHRHLSHLNFGAINHLARHGLVQGLPELKVKKDHMCSTCAMGKSKKKPHKPKFEDINQEKLYILHMDLCGPMRVASVNGKKYILVIVDDYSRFTRVKSLRSKDKAPDFISKFLKMIQLWLKVHVRRIRTDNGTEFVNQTLREYYEKVGISHETSIARSPQQNGVVKRRNRKLIEDARTILIYAKALLFLWAEAVATAYFDELTAMASTLHEMTPATISSGLVPNPPPLTLFVPPLRTDLDILFQLLFDELLNPPSSVDRPAPEVIASIAEVVTPEPAASTGSPSSTTVVGSQLTYNDRIP